MKKDIAKAIKTVFGDERREFKRDDEREVCVACDVGAHVTETPTLGTEQVHLLVGVYFQTSRRYRQLSRLPQGTNGLDALNSTRGRGEKIEALTNPVDRVQQERSCGDQYLRCYAPEEDQIQLSAEEFALYRKLGGGTYRDFKHIRCMGCAEGTTGWLCWACYDREVGK